MHVNRERMIQRIREYHNSDNKTKEEVSEETFWRECERVGRRIDKSDVPQAWRWLGYHFGVDLLFKYDRGYG